MNESLKQEIIDLAGRIGPNVDTATLTSVRDMLVQLADRNDNIDLPGNDQELADRRRVAAFAAANKEQLGRAKGKPPTLAAREFVSAFAEGQRKHGWTAAQYIGDPIDPKTGRRKTA